VRRTFLPVLVLVVVAIPLRATPARAEVIEEIAAIVDGDIVTKTDLEEEERTLTSQAYAQLTGTELDRQVQEIRETVLLQMIERKMLLHRAETTFDMAALKDNLYQTFLQQQGFKDEAEFLRLLANEGLTLDELKQRLAENYAPEHLLWMELGHRVGVPEKDIEAYYREHPDEFTPPAEVTLREIVLLCDPGHCAERRAEAERIRQRALDGEDFAELAKSVSEAGTKDNGGLLAPARHGDLSEQLEGPAFSLPIGSISDVIEADYGFHLIRLESRTEAVPRPYDEIHDRLRDHLEDLRYSTERATYMKQVRDSSEWCVERDYASRIPDDVESKVCDGL